MVLYILLFTLTICLFLKVWCKRWKFESDLKGFTTPPGLPLLKHFYLFSSESSLEANLLDIVKKYGSFVKLELFYGLPLLLVTDKDFVNYILTVKPIYTKDTLYDLSKPFAGDGLVTCAPSKWKKSKKIINPAFNVQLLEQYVNNFDGPCDQLMKRLRENIGNDDGFDAFDYTDLCTMDILCETFMGIKLNAQAKQNSQFVEDSHAATRIITDRLFSPLKRLHLIYIFTKQYWEQCKVATRMHNFTRKVIEDRRLSRQTSTAKDVLHTSIRRNRKTFIDILMDSENNGQPMNSEDIMYETLTFLFAGHDTVAVAISSCLYCLSKYSELQDKVFAELQSIFAGDKRNPTWADLSEMRYLEMVIKETMRLYTPIPLISRLVDEDIHYGNVFVPKGTSLIVYMQGVHMNPEYYPEPEKFDPLRFESEIKHFTFMPFGAGPRNCIGQRFAMLEMKYVICQVLRNFIILPVPGHTPQRVIQVLLRLKNGAMIRLKSR